MNPVLVLEPGNRFLDPISNRGTGAFETQLSCRLTDRLVIANAARLPDDYQRDFGDFFDTDLLNRSRSITGFWHAGGYFGCTSDSQKITVLFYRFRLFENTQGILRDAFDLCTDAVQACSLP